MHEGKAHRGAHRVHSPANYSTQWVPCSVVKPVPKVVEALLGEEGGHSVVEVGIKLVDHALVLHHREQANAEFHDTYEQQRSAIRNLRIC